MLRSHKHVRFSVGLPALRAGMPMQADASAHVQIRRVADDANFEVRRGDVHRELLRPNPWGAVHEQIKLLQSLIPGVDGAPLVLKLVPVGGGNTITHCCTSYACVGLICEALMASDRWSNPGEIQTSRMLTQVEHKALHQPFPLIYHSSKAVSVFGTATFAAPSFRLPVRPAAEPPRLAPRLPPRPRKAPRPAAAGLLTAGLAGAAASDTRIVS